MRIAIRADASVQIGTGHIHRCLTLADEFRARGAEVVFVSRALGIDSRGIIEAAGHRAIDLLPPAASLFPGDDLPVHAGWAEVPWEQDAAETCVALADFVPQVLVVDHYAFDARWHDRVRAGLGASLVAIDDLGDRPLAVEIIVDQNFSADHAAKHVVSSVHRPTILGGPSFALLSQAYRRRVDFEVRDTVASVGIFMGGSDIANSTKVAWHAVRSALGPAVEVELVATRANPHLAALQSIVETDARTRLALDLPDLAGFFAAHDLQIGAGGGATWERCCIGVPTVAVAFAANQVPVLKPLDDAGILCFSTAGASDAQALASDIAPLAADRIRRAAVSEQARKLVDGRGAGRVAGALTALAAAHGPLRLRDATEADAVLAHGWRNAEPTRRYFRSPEPVELPDHLRWWRNALTSGDRRLLIAEHDGAPCAVLRFDFEPDATEAEVSIYIAPGRTGHGLGTDVLHAAAIRARELGIERLRAEIDPANTPSQRAFARAGFSRLDERTWWRRLA